jgi:hypothetical protein
MDPRPRRGPALAPPEASFAVFAQSRDASVDIAAWNRHAERFFATRVGLTEERRGPATTLDVVGFVIAPTEGRPAIRRAFARPAQEADYARAEAAEAGAGGGLARLARRCGMVWLVEREDEEAEAATEPTTEPATEHARQPAARPPIEGLGDRSALLLAAILASILLGPILDGRARELFGVKTARAKLEAR